MPILELCAGYGGLGRAVEALTGERVRYVAEVDPNAALILSARYPEAPNIGDIREFDWSRIAGRVNIITAGFPCQDISNAGKRAGIHGERSSLWRHVAEAVRVLRPDYVFLENVAAIRRRGLQVVLGDLAEIGYDARWTSFRASGIGAPHHRDRWFCVASPSAHPDRIGRHEGAGLREG
ncbi:DNA cytosine methyltransferase [Kitasatospora sp. NPDC059408]|uniref:DNA cytosine methyltransferase n=1 Tax=Kitasatospora sp. NPDC059408 TaxID=3346823 RepID=UPI0036A97AE9